MFKVNNRNTRKSCEICSKLTIKTPERRRSGVFMLTLNIIHTFFSVSIVDFKQVNVNWDNCLKYLSTIILKQHYIQVLFPSENSATASVINLTVRFIGGNFSFSAPLVGLKKEHVTLSCVILKNGQMYFKNVLAWAPQHF